MGNRFVFSVFSPEWQVYSELRPESRKNLSGLPPQSHRQEERWIELAFSQYEWPQFRGNPQLIGEAAGLVVRHCRRARIRRLERRPFLGVGPTTILNLFRNYKWFAILACQQFVSFRVMDEFFRFRIEFEFLSCTVGNYPKMP